MLHVLTSCQVCDELGKLVGVTGSFGFNSHGLKISTPSRERKLFNFKVTHYQIGKLYDVERDINRQPADVRSDLRAFAKAMNARVICAGPWAKLGR